MGTLDGPTAVNRSQNMSAPISKKRKFVADGVFYAELNEMLARELSEQNYAGVEVRVTPNRTEIIIKATHTQDVLGDRGRRIRELTAVIQKRFGFKDGAVELYAQKVVNRGPCYGIVRYIMESEAKGCEVVVTGKLRAARAK